MYVMQSWFLGYMDSHSNHYLWLNHEYKIECLQLCSHIVNKNDSFFVGFFFFFWGTGRWESLRPTISQYSLAFLFPFFLIDGLFILTKFAQFLKWVKISIKILLYFLTLSTKKKIIDVRLNLTFICLLVDSD